MDDWIIITKFKNKKKKVLGLLYFGMERGGGAPEIWLSNMKSVVDYVAYSYIL